MRKYNCKINPECLKMPKYSTWLQLVPIDETKLHCKSCVDILNMRKSAVESHYNRTTHKKRSALLNAQLDVLVLIEDQEQILKLYCNIDLNKEIFTKRT